MILYFNYHTNEDVDNAAMKLMVGGVEKKHISDKDKSIAAIHEAGHTIMNYILGNTVTKVSIQAYSSGVGGLTITDGDNSFEGQLKTRTDLERDIDILLSGGLAEEIVFMEHSLGWSNDLCIVTNIVEDMYYQWGMLNNYVVCGGVSVTDSRDRENINLYISQRIKEVINVLSEHKSLIEELANELIEKETLYKDSIDSLLCNVVRKRV